MMEILGFLLALIAFGLFGLVNDDHYRDLFGKRPDKLMKKRLKQGASVVLILSFFATCLGRGWVMGPVIWTGEIMLAAGVVFLSFNFMPKDKKG